MKEPMKKMPGKMGATKKKAKDAKLPPGFEVSMPKKKGGGKGQPAMTRKSMNRGKK